MNNIEFWEELQETSAKKEQEYLKFKKLEEKYGGMPLEALLKIFEAYVNDRELDIYFKDIDPEYANWPFHISPRECLNLDDMCIDGYDDFTNDGYSGPDGQYYEEPLYFDEYGKRWAFSREEFKE